MVAGPTPAEVLAAEMVAIPAGTIVLRDEGTRRTWPVEITSFQLARVPVVPELLRALLSDHPGSARTRTPLTDVSWLDAVGLCNDFSRVAGLTPCYTLGPDPDAADVRWDRTADGYRLPTEAEWEHACRAHDPDVRYGDLDTIGWYRQNSGGRPHEVATKTPNAWGLHDMIGNVWEWCWDVYDARVYGPYRVFRGGGWSDLPRSCRASCRRKSHPSLRIDDLGFRLARSPTPAAAAP